MLRVGHCVQPICTKWLMSNTASLLLELWHMIGRGGPTWPAFKALHRVSAELLGGQYTCHHIVRLRQAAHPKHPQWEDLVSSGFHPLSLFPGMSFQCGSMSPRSIYLRVLFQDYNTSSSSYNSYLSEWYHLSITSTKILGHLLNSPLLSASSSVA